MISKYLSSRLLFFAFVLAMSSTAFAGARLKVIYSPSTSTSPGGAGGSLVVDKSGNMYATGSGGSGVCQEQGGGEFPCGSAYKLAPPTSIGAPWTATELYSFQGPPTDGESGSGPILFDSRGNIFGATIIGGNGFGTGDFICGSFELIDGCGTIFQLSPPAQSGGAWTETVIYNFQGLGDGEEPVGRLASDASGNIYGVTYFDGASEGGVIYKLSPPAQNGGSWSESVLYQFGQNSGDGLNPRGGLLRDARGNLYGTTAIGANPGCFGQGCGAVYRLSPPSQDGGAWTETVLYRFTGGADGASPSGELAMDAAGNLYGTTTNGLLAEPGTVFRLSPAAGSWILTTLHTFTFHGDGAIPEGGVILDKQGNLYGVTRNGGDATTATGCSFERMGCGTIYEISPTSTGWNEQILHYFHQNDNIGIFPTEGLVFGRGGSLYGTIGGNVFQLILP